MIQLVDTRSGGTAAGPITEYQLRHILVRTDAQTNDAAARAKLETLRARIAGGADFAALARTYGRMGGMDRVATVVKAIRAARPDSILLDGGDTWHGSMTSLR